MVPSVANPNIDGAKRQVGVGCVLATGDFGIDFVAIDLDNTGVVVEMRDCICEKRAPLPGPCQAFAEKASGARMAGEG